ncbi:DUF4307 domain-containing protein [Saccharomonospora azurea]|uniref:DUF4307 domain-containing protein n=1 Tax=Saccharomonospora azurea NA-128 TaxID=882081 RepID=H8GD61_9PSEU|nr:DUF4307 domain-containing protein [Saccharomonospora azurea]EHK87134.1 hypothetical protein SZMC14600_11898 [Saccharomonospora azurea SZMC 14600]EHY88850.1 hypothetical protein SacazDRAFT_01932 [Saccharomonospora azurea NA-128]
MSSSESDRESVDALEDRYGSARIRRPRRPLQGKRAWWFGVTVFVVLGVASYVVYTQWFATPIDGQRVAFDERPGNAMEITVDVNRDDPSRPAVCIVRVRDIEGAETGRKELYVPPGASRLDTVVRSIGRPVTADVYGCSYDVPKYLSTPQRPTE